MDLNGATWMVRQLEQSVSMVHLDEHHGVFAGGWDGRLTHWDEAGEHVWTAQTNDRISALALNEHLAVVASGLHIVALDRATGEERWSMALEGSADAVVWWQGDVVAVSSVYDIEHNDFIESAIWRFSQDGDLQWVERMDERPWTLIEVDDRLLAGLGRPRCGHLDVSSTPPFHHTLPPTSSPTTCGTGGRTQGLFGQTDGNVVSHEGTVLSTEAGAVEHLTCMVKGYVATTDAGLAVGRTETGEQCWSSDGAPVSAQSEAMEHDGASLLWLARADGAGSQLRVWATNAAACWPKARSLRSVHARNQRTPHRRLRGRQSSRVGARDAPPSSQQRCTTGRRGRRSHVSPSGKTSGASSLTQPCFGPVICSGRTHSSNSSLVR